MRTAALQLFVMIACTAFLSAAAPVKDAKAGDAKKNGLGRNIHGNEVAGSFPGTWSPRVELNTRDPVLSGRPTGRLPPQGWLPPRDDTENIGVSRRLASKPLPGIEPGPENVGTSPNTDNAEKSPPSRQVSKSAENARSNVRKTPTNPLSKSMEARKTAPQTVKLDPHWDAFQKLDNYANDFIRVHPIVPPVSPYEKTHAVLVTSDLVRNVGAVLDANGNIDPDIIKKLERKLQRLAEPKPV